MSQVYVKITSCMYKKGTADQRKKRKKEKKRKNESIYTVITLFVKS